MILWPAHFYPLTVHVFLHTTVHRLTALFQMVLREAISLARHAIQVIEDLTRYMFLAVGTPIVSLTILAVGSCVRMTSYLLLKKAEQIRSYQAAQTFVQRHLAHPIFTLPIYYLFRHLQGPPRQLLLDAMLARNRVPLPDSQGSFNYLLQVSVNFDVDVDRRLYLSSVISLNELPHPVLLMHMMSEFTERRLDNTRLNARIFRDLSAFTDLYRQRMGSANHRDIERLADWVAIKLSLYPEVGVRWREALSAAHQATFDAMLANYPHFNLLYDLHPQRKNEIDHPFWEEIDCASSTRIRELAARCACSVPPLFDLTKRCIERHPRLRGRQGILPLDVRERLRPSFLPLHHPVIRYQALFPTTVEERGFVKSIVDRKRVLLTYFLFPNPMSLLETMLPYLFAYYDLERVVVEGRVIRKGRSLTEVTLEECLRMFTTRHAISNVDERQKIAQICGFLVRVDDFRRKNPQLGHTQELLPISVKESLRASLPHLEKEPIDRKMKKVHLRTFMLNRPIHLNPLIRRILTYYNYRREDLENPRKLKKILKLRNAAMLPLLWAENRERYFLREIQAMDISFMECYSRYVRRDVGTNTEEIKQSYRYLVEWNWNLLSKDSDLFRWKCTDFCVNNSHHVSKPNLSQ